MLKSLFFLPLVGLMACDAATSEETSGATTGGVEANVCGQALTAGNGTTLNGLNVNGLNVNGLNVNGLNVNGLNVNGLNVNGLNVNGLNVNGLNVNGLNVNGLSLKAVLGDGQIVWFKIAAVEQDSAHGNVMLYTVELDGQNICGDGGKGIFVPGIWDESGAHHAQATIGSTTIDTTFSCASGAIGKCVLWGYRPWVEGAEAHQACTRMVRADYCGDGVGHTQNGTVIDVFDGMGVQTAVDAPGLTFEAGWGPNGATCVRESRYVSLDRKGNPHHPSCWASLPRCETWDQALSQGAILGNDSAHTQLACVQ